VKRFTFTAEARADLRRIERDQALLILKALTRFAAEGTGDIKKLVDDASERYRFRVGDWRVFFRFEENETLHVVHVENRRDAYR
jgi:mRNA interferase RelE/StbE